VKKKKENKGTLSPRGWVHYERQKKEKREKKKGR